MTDMPRTAIRARPVSCRDRILPHKDTLQLYLNDPLTGIAANISAEAPGIE
jgi:hypothetical protein